METKKHIRDRVLRLRDAMAPEERLVKSRKIMKKLKQTEAYINAELLLTYINYKSEVETKELIGDALTLGKKVYCPKVDGENIEFYRISSKEEVRSGYKGIPEPAGHEDSRLTENEISAHRCLMLMPGSAFDHERNRIGYGKGFYDRYLERYPQLESIAVCFACQLVEDIPAQVYDRRPDMIISEEELII